MNLVKNAVQNTDSGFIEIRTSREDAVSGNILRVIVQDTGKGFAHEEIPSLFTRFGKHHRTASINSDGLGLGLMIVKEIVKHAGGAITVESAGQE